jgi:hypothetical protein
LVSNRVSSYSNTDDEQEMEVAAMSQIGARQKESLAFQGNSK